MTTDYFSKPRLSLLIVFMLGILIVVLRFLYPPVNVLSWDVFGYYLYLPAKFIYHDLGLTNQDWVNALIQKYNSTGTLYQAYIGPTGQWVMKYPMGMAIFYFPFFLIAHLSAQMLGFPADGLSLPYQYGIASGMIIYTFAGLYFLRKVLLLFFNDRTTSFVLLVVVLTTNFINHSTTANLLSHNVLFFLVGGFVWLTIKWHKNPKIVFIILLALTTGLITLVRPNEIVVMLFFLIYGVKDKKTLKRKFNLFLDKKIQILVGITMFLLVIFPQLYYWKIYTGSYLFYSYPNAGEGFDLLNPHTLKFFLSFRKGWLIYTPVIIFFFAGLIILYKKRKEIFYATVVYLVISIYLISSWTCWWYAGGCYSQRAIVPLYVILAIPFGYFVNHILQKNTVIKLMFIVVISMFTLLNLFQFWQFHSDILKHDGVTRNYYLSIFGRTEIPENAEGFLLVGRSVTAFEQLQDTQNYHKKTIGLFLFDKPQDAENQIYTRDPQDSNRFCLALDSGNMYSPGAHIKYKNITGEYYAWIRSSVEVYIDSLYSEEMPVLVITFEHKGGSYKYFGGNLDVAKENRNTWKKFMFDYQTPEVRSKNDRLKVYVWHRGKRPVLIRNLRVDVFEPIIE